MAKRYGLPLPLLNRACEFQSVFDANERHTTFTAVASLGRVQLKVCSRNKEHYDRTLAYWRKLKAENIVEINK